MVGVSSRSPYTLRSTHSKATLPFCQWAANFDCVSTECHDLPKNFRSVLSILYKTQLLKHFYSNYYFKQNHKLTVALSFRECRIYCFHSEVLLHIPLSMWDFCVIRKHVSLAIYYGFIMDLLWMNANDRITVPNFHYLLFSELLIIKP